MSSSQPGSSRLLRRLLHAVDIVQVELQGQYSLLRLRHVQQYVAETSLYQALLVIAITPLPCLLTLILLDITPLHAAAAGVHHQTTWFWFRLLFSVGVVGFAITLQLRQSAPSLPMAPVRLMAISLLLGVSGTAEFFAFGVYIGFPTPFALQLITVTFVIKLATCLGISWAPTLLRDSEARANLTRYLIAYGSEVGILFVYPVYYYAFSSLSGLGQTMFSLVLPLLKIFFKNWASYGMLHMEDLAPTTIVFNIDVFHALFVSPTMQKSKSMGATLSIMGVDLLQSALKYYNVHDVLTKYERLSRLAKTNAAPSSLEVVDTSDPETDPLDAVQYALRVVDTNARIRDHPAIALPRHLRHKTPANDRLDDTLERSSSVPPSPLDIRPVGRTRIVPIVLEHSVVPEPAVVSSLSPAECQQLQSVAAVLQLMHMAEFYVLIEYVEVMMAVMYTVYLAVITNHANRAYYTHLRELSDEELRSSVIQVAFYAVLELLSFVVFCWLLDRKLRHFSTIRQLAFALRRHWQMAQVVLLLWVIFVVQMSLEHAGCDYTFQFAWLRAQTPDGDTTHTG